MGTSKEVKYSSDKIFFSYKNLKNFLRCSYFVNRSKIVSNFLPRGCYVITSRPVLHPFTPAAPILLELAAMEKSRGRCPPCLGSGYCMGELKTPA